MKKLFMIAAMALSTLTMSAQDDPKFTIYAGVGMSGVAGEHAKNLENALSYKIGMNYDISLSESFSIIPGLELANKSQKVKHGDGTTNKFYAQVPVLFAGKIKVSDSSKLVVKAGPYLGVGLFGSENVFDTNKGGCKRLDAGLHVGLSYDVKSFTIGAEYTRAFTKLAKEAKLYNQQFGLTIGYKL